MKIAEFTRLAKTNPIYGVGGGGPGKGAGVYDPWPSPPNNLFQQPAKAFSDDLLEHLIVQGKIRRQPARSFVFSSSCRSFRTSEGIKPPNFFFQRENVCSVMPIWRMNSTTVPGSACCRAKAICCSVKGDRFLGKILLPDFSILAKFSHHEGSNCRGAGQPAQG